MALYAILRRSVGGHWRVLNQRYTLLPHTVFKSFFFFLFWKLGFEWTERRALDRLKCSEESKKSKVSRLTRPPDSPIVPVLQRLRKKNFHKFKVNLGYVVSFRSVLVTEWDPVSKASQHTKTKKRKDIGKKARDVMVMTSKFAADVLRNARTLKICVLNMGLKPKIWKEERCRD